MTNYLMGIDVSIWQNEVDWQKVANSNYKDFAYIKASERFVVDKFFINNWRNAKGLVPRGAYLYFHPDRDVKEQIDYFCDLLIGDIGELRPSLDVEDHGNLSSSALAENILFALQHIEVRLKVKPIIYTSANWWKEHIGISLNWVKDYPLWIARYNLNIIHPGALPPGFDDWAIWQYWHRGEIDGITGKKPDGKIVRSVDLNRMKIEYADKIFIKGALTLEQRVERIENILKKEGLL